MRLAKPWVSQRQGAAVLYAASGRTKMGLAKGIIVYGRIA